MLFHVDFWNCDLSVPLEKIFQFLPGSKERAGQQVIFNLCFAVGTVILECYIIVIHPKHERCQNHTLSSFILYPFLSSRRIIPNNIAAYSKRI